MMEFGKQRCDDADAIRILAHLVVDYLRARRPSLRARDREELLGMTKKVLFLLDRMLAVGPGPLLHFEQNLAISSAQLVKFFLVRGLLKSYLRSTKLPTIIITMDTFMFIANFNAIRREFENRWEVDFGRQFNICALVIARERCKEYIQMYNPKTQILSDPRLITFKSMETFMISVWDAIGHFLAHT